MSFQALYEEVQLTSGKISTNWIEERAVALSRITKITEMWSDVIDPHALRGFYIEGPLGPPIELGENESLIGLSRRMCKGAEGKYYRRYVKTKEIMHVFDTDQELTNTAEKFDKLVERFADPAAAVPPQYYAESKAIWRALAVLCREEQRIYYKEQIAQNAMSVEVVSTALQIPTLMVRQLMRDNFLDYLAIILND